MAFLQFSLNIQRATEVLELIVGELKLIREALQRLAPELPQAVAPYQAKLSDLRNTDSETVSRIAEELKHYANENGVRLHSEKFIESIMRFEHEVREVWGPEALFELPWNRAAGGLLFSKDEAHQSRTRSAEAGRRSDSAPDREPPANP